jgi:hypothetical protein
MLKSESELLKKAFTGITTYDKKKSWKTSTGICLPTSPIVKIFYLSILWASQYLLHLYPTQKCV